MNKFWMNRAKLNLKYVDILWIQCLIVLRLKEGQISIKGYTYTYTHTPFNT